MMLTEAQWWDRLGHFRGSRYARRDRDVRYPFPLPGVSGLTILQRGELVRINCCCLFEALACGAILKQDPTARFSDDLHKLFMIRTRDRFGPVSAAVALGIAELCDPSAVRNGGWFVFQGWRKDGGGHTFMLIAHHVVTDRVLFLEANLGYGLDGVGSRGIGAIDDFLDFHPGRDWWRRQTAWTLRQVLDEYPEVKCARLFIQPAAVHPWESMAA